MYCLLPLFRERGKNIWFDPNGLYSFENIILGSDVSSQRTAQNSGPSGSLLLPRKALSSSVPCRFIPAHHHIFSRHGFSSRL